MGGSGFLVSVIFEDYPQRSALYIVTNAHVVAKGGVVVRINRKSGGFDVIDGGPASLWTYADEDDLAVLPIGDISEQHHRFSHLRLGDLFVSPETIAINRIGPGDPTYTIGRFINYEGKQQNTPSVRFGEIAMMPHEPIRLESGLDQVGFLVEARSIPAYSGSPVFVQLAPFRPDGGMVISGDFWFLGIDCAHTNDMIPVYDKAGKETEYWMKTNTGYMVVVPAWKLSELLRSQALVEHRVVVAKECKRQDSKAASLDS